MTRGGPTIRDVAKRAGVSIATVSYVLNGRSAVAQETRGRVLEAMQELSYHPSAAARSLLGRRTSMVGFLIPHPPETIFLDPYFAELIRGVAIMADAHQYNPVIVTVESEAHAHEVYARIVQNGLVDGVVMCCASNQHTYLVDDMLRDGIRFVVIGSAMPGTITFVDVDNRGGAEAAVEHLLSLGHRSIAFINGPPDYFHARQRLVGFLSALRAHDISLESCPVVNGSFSREGGYAAMNRLLDAEARPTAVFLASDLMAVGAMQCLHERGLRIPDDLSLVGFDDTLLATATSPPLTTVHQPLTEMAAAATQLALALGHGEQPPQLGVEIATTLTVRESTAPPKN